MARGWESKAVEEQIGAAQEKPKEGRRPVSADEAERTRQRQSLELSRARIVAQIRESHNPRFTEMTQKALAELEARLARFQ